MLSQYLFRPVALATLALTASGSLFAQTSVDLYAHLSPVRAPNDDGGFFYISPSFDAYRVSVLAGLAAGGVAVGSGPTGFLPLNQTDFTPFETTGTPFHSWRGQINPSGAYADEYGTFLRVAARVVSGVAFNLGNVLVSGSAPEFDISPTGIEEISGGFRNGGSDLAGIWWGADGIRGTADDVYYDDTRADATTPLNELFWLGAAFVNVYYTADDLAALGSPEAVLADANAYYAAYSQYEYAVRVDLVGMAMPASADFSATITAVPEPATWALMSAALGGIALAIRRKRPSESAVS